MKRALALALCLFAGLAHADSAMQAPVSLPIGALNSSGLVYASTAPVTVNSSTPTSVFPSGSTAARTFAANTLTPGRAFGLVGGGVYSVPTPNTLSADIVLKVGSATIVSVQTPSAPTGTNAGIDFHAECVVVSTTTMICTGVFTFAVLGTTPVIVPFNSVTAKTFDPTVANLIEVTGDWNGTTSTHACTVQTAALFMRN